MIQLQPIIDGQCSVMLTPFTIEQAEQSCRDRFGDRFQGFAPIPTETKARCMWAAYTEKRITRPELEAWLEKQGDEAAIRAELNRMRGGNEHNQGDIPNG